MSKTRKIVYSVIMWGDEMELSHYEGILDKAASKIHNSTRVTSISWATLEDIQIDLLNRYPVTDLLHGFDQRLLLARLMQVSVESLAKASNEEVTNAIETARQSVGAMAHR